ncbi:Cupin domain protein [Tindallia magadiensis]|uniref:Cupin domain protein n=1 Tax=Tindallia magadiensis TaxID=69895 RepID=A0A1I3C011_9FIRM|nr:XRE family transcriptional regulator [Tindallia magadiensis]SFH67822.1 Cupin domain protein [Tindallia magadiensis]
MQEVSKKIREIRKERGLTLKELSERTGFSISFLSQVERETSSIAITSLKKIADSLHVPITTFFKAYDNEHFLVNKEDQKSFLIEGSSTEYIRLSGTFQDRALESLMVTLQPEEKHGHLFSHQGEEFLYVLEGAVVVTIDGDDYTVYAGDSIHYPSGKPHLWTNPLEEKTRFLCILTPVIL